MTAERALIQNDSRLRDFDVFGTAAHDEDIFGGGGIVTNVSRAHHAPFWNRPDLIRGVEYQDFTSTFWQSNSCKKMAHTITNSGAIVSTPRDHIVSVMPNFRDAARYETAIIAHMLFNFQTLTETQLFTLTGLPHDMMMRGLSILFHAGVIDFLRGDNKKDFYTGRIWHLVDNRDEFWDFVNKLPAVVRTLMLGDFNRVNYNTPPGGNSTSSVRHNLIASEIVIRAFEACNDIVGFFGEPFLSIDNFTQFDAESGYEYRANHGDGALITKDGTIIMMELVGGVAAGENFKRIESKAAAWTAAAGSSHHDMAIVFINMNSVENYPRIVRACQKAVRDGAYMFGNQLAVMNGQPRIFAVNFPYWFPEIGCVNDHFINLEAYNIQAQTYMPMTIPNNHGVSRESRVRLIENTLLSPTVPNWFFEPRLQQFDYYNAEDDMRMLRDDARTKAMGKQRVYDLFQWNGGVYSIDKDC